MEDLQIYLVTILTLLGATYLQVFLSTNIPTIIFIIIYIVCSKGVKRNREIEKMNIQDLE